MYRDSTLLIAIAYMTFVNLFYKTSKMLIEIKSNKRANTNEIIHWLWCTSSTHSYQVLISFVTILMHIVLVYWLLYICSYVLKMHTEIMFKSNEINIKSIPSFSPDQKPVQTWNRQKTCGLVWWKIRIPLLFCINDELNWINDVLKQ